MSTNSSKALKVLAIFISFFLAFSAAAQDMSSIEKGLLAKYQRITYWLSYYTDDTTVKVDKYDSLEKANWAFQNALLQVTASSLASLNYPFKTLQDSGLTVTTSNDAHLRVYSWDTEEGGTMHIFASVYQFRTTKGVQSKTFQDSPKEANPGEWCPFIYTLRTPSKTYYLVVNYAIFSHQENHQGIQTFTIGKNSLNDSVKLFKTKTGFRNGISVDFNFFSVEKRQERPVRLVTFDSSKKEVRIPVVEGRGTVTDRSIVYRWTGSYFERK